MVAAIASDGVLREPRMGSYSPEDIGADPLLPPEAAALLGQYMRDAVLTGTGRSLRNNPLKIAGKTGTAEVKGSKSHAWFVGFAPYGSGTKKIAFAVIIENAGYGGLAAAPAAGRDRQRGSGFGAYRMSRSVMNIFGNLRRLESRLANTVDGAAQRGDTAAFTRTVGDPSRDRRMCRKTYRTSRPGKVCVPFQSNWNPDRRRIA